MRFGLETEKLLYDVKNQWVAKSAYRILDSLDDYKVVYGDEPVDRIKAEFVLNLLEIASSPSDRLLEVARDYLFSYELVKEAATRGKSVPLPLGAFPGPFQPIMVTKWRYFVQNAILTKNPDVGWTLEKGKGLFDGSNCAGVHVHAEVFTPPEFAALNRELADKHNIGAMLVPMIAFSSSPYFFGNYEAKSSRALRYFLGVYKDHPELGGLPPVVKESIEVLKFYRDGLESWHKQATDIGFEAGEIERLFRQSGAYWGMVRWNRKWNTIELRCLDGDLVDLNVAKFAVIAGAFRRLAKGKDFAQTRILEAPDQIDASFPAHEDRRLDVTLKDLVEACWEIGTDGTVAVLPEPYLHRLIGLAVREGLSSPIVYRYLEKVLKFGVEALNAREKPLALPLFDSHKNRQTTADWILELNGGKPTIVDADVRRIIDRVLEEEGKRYEQLVSILPKSLQPPKEFPGPGQGAPKS